MDDCPHITGTHLLRRNIAVLKLGFGDRHITGKLYFHMCMFLGIIDNAQIWVYGGVEYSLFIVNIWKLTVSNFFLPVYCCAESSGNS